MTIVPVRQRGGVAIARHHDGCATGRTGRRADDGAFLSADERAENRAANRGSADFARAFTCRRFALSIDGLRADRKLRSVGEDQRVEPDAEPRPLLDFAATLHERHRSDRLRAGGDGDPSVSHDVPGYATVDAILDVRTLGRDRRLHAQANHRRCRDDELVDLRWRRCFRTWSNLGNLTGCRRRRRGRRCDLRDLATLAWLNRSRLLTCRRRLAVRTARRCRRRRLAWPRRCDLTLDLYGFGRFLGLGRRRSAPLGGRSRRLGWLRRLLGVAGHDRFGFGDGSGGLRRLRRGGSRCGNDRLWVSRIVSDGQIGTACSGSHTPGGQHANSKRLRKHGTLLYDVRMSKRRAQYPRKSSPKTPLLDLSARQNET